MAASNQDEWRVSCCSDVRVGVSMNAAEMMAIELPKTMVRRIDKSIFVGLPAELQWSPAP